MTEIKESIFRRAVALFRHGNPNKQPEVIVVFKTEVARIAHMLENNEQYQNIGEYLDNLVERDWERRHPKNGN